MSGSCAMASGGGERLEEGTHDRSRPDVNAHSVTVKSIRVGSSFMISSL